MIDPAGLKLCFSTLACPDWTWSELLAHAGAAGYQGIELRMLRRETNLLSLPEFETAVVESRCRELSACGLSIVGLGSSVRFDYLDGDELQRQIEIGYRYVDLAQRLHASFVRVFGDVFTAGTEPAGRERVLAQIQQSLQYLGDYASDRNVLILMETHGDFAASRWMRTVMQRVDQPGVGILWDTHHPWRFYNEPVAETFDRLRPWIRHTHWKDSVSHSVMTTSDSSDAGARASALMSGHRPANYVLLGEGEFPAADALLLLQANGYDGWYSLEWELAWHPELAGPLTALPDFPKKMIALHHAVGRGNAGR